MVTIPQEAKDALRRDSVKKELVIHFPNKEYPDIRNANLIEETSDFTESICSRDHIIFGLCESSSFNFEAFDIDDIEGCEIESRINVDIDDVKEARDKTIVTNWATGATIGETVILLCRDSYENPKLSKEGNTDEEHENISYYYLDDLDTLYLKNLKQIKITIDSNREEQRAYDSIYLLSSGYNTLENKYRIDSDYYRDNPSPTAQEIVNTRTNHVTYTLYANEITDDFKFSAIRLGNRYYDKLTLNVKVEIEYSKWPFLYGLFRVDTCTMKKDNPRIRRVKCYNMNAQPMSAFSNIEYAKMNTPVQSQTAFEFDYAKSALASIPRFNSAFFDYAEIDHQQERLDYIYQLEKYDSSMGDHRVQIAYQVSSVDRIYNEKEDVLYRYECSELVNSINYYVDETINYIIRVAKEYGDNLELTDLEKEAIKTRLSCCLFPYATLVDLEKTDYIYVSDGYNSGCVYPYLKGSGISFILPQNLKITISGVKGSSEIVYERSSTYSVHNSTRLYKVTCDEYFDIYKMSFERSKNEAGKGYLPDIQEIWSPYNFIQGLFELYGAFGKYHPDGRFKEFFLDSSRNVIWKAGLIDPDTGAIDKKAKNSIYSEPIECKSGDVISRKSFEASSSEKMYHIMTLFYDNRALLISSTNQNPTTAPKEATSYRITAQAEGIKTNFDLRSYVNKDTIDETITPEDWYEGDIEYGKSATLPYAYASCTYTNLDDEESYARVWIADKEDYNNHPDRYQVYTMGDNFLIQNMKYSPEAINMILRRVANHLSDISYYPINVKTRGLPYLRAGDKINIQVNNEVIHTYILERTISGIDHLEDSIGDGVGGGGSYSGNVNRTGNTYYGPGGGGGGSEVIANPQGEVTDLLNTIGINGTIYEIGDSKQSYYVSKVEYINENKFSVSIKSKGDSKEITNVYEKTEESGTITMKNLTNGLTTQFIGW